MPRTSAAIKSARQSRERQARLQPYKTHMKTMLRKIGEAAKAGNKDEAAKLLPIVFKSIDMAAKKKLIHVKTAARKKSMVSRLVKA